MKTENIVVEAVNMVVEAVTESVQMIFAGGVITGLGIKKVVKGVMKNVK